MMKSRIMDLGLGVLLWSETGLEKKRWRLAYILLLYSPTPSGEIMDAIIQTFPQIPCLNNSYNDI